MKSKDLGLLVILAGIFLPFLLSDTLFEKYLAFNRSYGFVMSFLKFGLLATIGELIAQRIRTGNYLREGFGVVPRALVWGLIGLTIKAAFIIFADGTPLVLEKLGLEGASASLSEPMGLKRVITAFSISLAMNLIYAPVMMLGHRLTDMHIEKNEGRLQALIRQIPIAAYLQEMDWNIFWGFIIVKTIPFFWIPAHTLTFLLPEDFRVLFAALLGMALGVILAWASLKSEK